MKSFQSFPPDDLRNKLANELPEGVDPKQKEVCTRVPNVSISHKFHIYVQDLYMYLLIHYLVMITTITSKTLQLKK